MKSTTKCISMTTAFLAVLASLPGLAAAEEVCPVEGTCAGTTHTTFGSGGCDGSGYYVESHSVGAHTDAAGETVGVNVSNYCQSYFGFAHGNGVVVNVDAGPAGSAWVHWADFDGAISFCVIAFGTSGIPGAPQYEEVSCDDSPVGAPFFGNMLP